MAKDTFYFPHDYNSKNDEKIKFLIRKHGMLGYGLFWSIVEDLYNNANALRLDYEGIAFDYRVNVEVVKSVINDFELFEFDGNNFGSTSIERRLNDRNLKSKKASQNALNRWNKVKSDANASKSDATAVQPLCDINAIKERKGKEIKEINTPKGVVPLHQENDLIKKESKEDWTDLLKKLPTIGDDQPTEEKKAQFQRIAIKEFIESKKPKYPEPYFLAYRFFANKEQIPVPNTLTDSRKKKFLVRLKEDSFDFYSILEGIHGSTFCKGDNDRKWKVDWDWIMENDCNYIKIIERKFE